MKAGVIEIFGTYYYTAGIGLILVSPFLLWFAISLLSFLIRWMAGAPVKRRSLAVSFIWTIVMLTVVSLDVFIIGQKAASLCNKYGGMHVYRTAEAESFIGDGIIELAKYGFKFTERRSDEGKIRYFYENGKPTYKMVDEFLSQYELVNTKKALTFQIEIRQYQIIDRFTNEVLGESASLTTYGGWADMLFYGITGFTFVPWECKCDGMSEEHPMDIVIFVLKPANEQK
ncbi:MAG: hypothetical protein RBR08_10850 [Desulforegulaceae bacterium]|nr:hypothetical protein [Desulforegulaceae bacterium]